MVGSLDRKYKIYCFDIFDTLIKRKIDPEAGKKIWASELAAVLNTSQSAADVYGIRFEIEAELCKKNSEAGYDLEFRYDDMLGLLYERVSINSGEMSLESFKKLARRMELQVECRVGEACTDTAALLKELKESGKRVICISDFYQPADFLKDLLGHFGMAQYIDKIYASCDYLVTKRSGRLYEKVLGEEKCSPEDMLMTGDNKNSDSAMAENAGIASNWLDRSEFYNVYADYKKKDNESNVVSLIGNIYNACNRDKYEDLAFSLYGFTKRLYDHLTFHNIRNVFFLSREGEFMKKLFDLYQEEQAPNKVSQIKSHYLMVSRKATLMPSLKPLDEEDFFTIFRQYINISLYDFMSSLGLDENVQESIAKRLEVNLYDRVIDLPRNELFKKLLDDELFQSTYEEHRMKQRDNFGRYLDSFGVDFDKESLTLVDVGWKGTIQDNIFNFFDKKREINGIYLGLVANSLEDPLNKKTGLLFDCITDNEITKFFNVYNENRSVFEVMLGASHGSANAYVENEEGRITVETSEKKEERELFRTTIKPMQDGIFETFAKIGKVVGAYAIDSKKLIETITDIHAKMVFMPTDRQIDLFHNIYHYENFGVFEFTSFKTAGKVGIAKKIKNCQHFLLHKKDFFKSSFWPAITIKDAGLSMLIKPYGRLKYRKHYLNEI